MSFDYGTSEEIKAPESNILKWPTEGERTGLVDADAIPYVVGYTSDLQQYLKMKRSKDWKTSEVFRSKIEHANFLLNKWLRAGGCDSALLYVTDSSNNFRLKIAESKTYKGERIEEKPPFFYEIKQWLIDFHGAMLSQECEADDEISIEAWSRHLAFLEETGELWTPAHKSFSNFVVISNDKDLGIIPSWQCHPKTGKLEWVEPLGELRPVYKTTQVNDYEYWPLFNGKPVDLIACRVPVMYEGKIQVKIKGELACDVPKWETDYVWYKALEGGKGLQQDTFIRGASKGKGKFKRICVGKKSSETIDKLKGVGLKFFYSQLITGDMSDNYTGLEGKGNVFAFELLNDAKDEAELFERVFKAYVEAHGSEEKAKEALREQGRLAHMQTKRGELWDLPNAKRQTFPA